MQGAVGLAIWVAAVGNQKKPCHREPTAQRLRSDESETLLTGRVWRKAEGPGVEVELVIMDSDDDPNGTYISEEALMNELQVRISFLKSMLFPIVQLHELTTGFRRSI